MRALDLPDSSLCGVLAYHSFIHVPLDRRSDDIVEVLRAAGFDRCSTTVREPEGPEESLPQGLVMARRTVVAAP